MGLGFMYQSSIKGVSRVDMFNLSLDIDAFDVLGSRYISEENSGCHLKIYLDLGGKYFLSKFVPPDLQTSRPPDVLISR